MNRVFSNRSFRTVVAALALCVMLAALTMPVQADGADFENELLDMSEVLVPTAGWMRIITDTGHRMTFTDLDGIFQIIDESKLLASPFAPPEALAFAHLLSPGMTVDLTLASDDERTVYMGIRWTDPDAGTFSLYNPGWNQVLTGDPTPIGSYGFTFMNGEMIVHRHYEDGFHGTFAGELIVWDGGLGDPWVDDLFQPEVFSAYIFGEVCAPRPDEHEMSFSWSVPDMADLPCSEPPEEEEEEPLQIVDVKPEPRRENVDYKYPSIRIAFSDTLKPASVPGNVEVFTMSPSGNEMHAAGTALADGNEITFRLDEPLWDGVIYEVRVRGGEGGVVSEDDDPLPDDFSWRFSTVIDIEQRFDPQLFAGAVTPDLPPDGPVQSFVYQTVRDAPLISGKPTLTRIYVHWAEYDHIASDWQPTSFRARVQAEDSNDGAVYTHVDRPYRVQRPDQFTDSDRRFARNTVNLFNWRPLPVTAGTTLTVSVEPEDVYPQRNEEYVFQEEKFVGRWPHPPKHLTFDYFTLPLGDWAEGIPPEDERLARQISRATETHLVQLFPIGSARSRDMGMLESNMGDWRTVQELIADGVVMATEGAGAAAHGAFQLLGQYDFVGDPQAAALRRELWRKASDPFQQFAESREAGMMADVRKVDAVKRMMERIHNVHGPRTNADVLVGYIPLSYYSGGQALSSIDYDWSAYADIPSGVQFFRRTVFLPVWPEGPSTMGLAHEIGHVYHLHHEPVSETTEQREAVAAQWQSGHYPGIDGFRIAPGGASGWNKSSTDGNAQHATTLLSFMFPVSRAESETFISDTHYDSLLNTFLSEALRQQGARLPLPSVQVASTDAFAAATAFTTPVLPGRQTDTGLMMIAGYVHKEAPVVYVDAVRRRVEYARHVEEGPYAAVLRDESGSVLARQSFGEYVVPGFANFDDPWVYFQVYLPEDDRARRIEIWEGETLLVAWERPETRPEVRFTAPFGPVDDSGGGTVTVAWEAGVDGEDRLLYTLLYSPDGRFPWSTLASDTTETSVVVGAERLAPGTDPTLRLLAGNGFDEVEVRLSVDVQRDPEPTAPVPAAVGGIDDAVGAADEGGEPFPEDPLPVDRPAGFFDGLPPVAADDWTPGGSAALFAKHPGFGIPPSWSSGSGPEEPFDGDVDDYLAMWQDQAAAFGLGDEFAEFLDFLGGASGNLDSLDEIESLWDVMAGQMDEDDFGTMMDEWFGDDMDWDELQRELDEYEATMQSWADLETARPVDVDADAAGPVAPGTGVLHMDDSQWVFDIASCALPPPGEHNMEVLGSGNVQGTGQPFDITIAMMDLGMGPQYIMRSVVVQSDDDVLMVTAEGPDGPVSFTWSEDGALQGEGTITSFITFNNYEFLLAAHCQ